VVIFGGSHLGWEKKVKNSCIPARGVCGNFWGKPFGVGEKVKNSCIPASGVCGNFLGGSHLGWKKK